MSNAVIRLPVISRRFYGWVLRFGEVAHAAFLLPDGAGGWDVRISCSGGHLRDEDVLAPAGASRCRRCEINYRAHLSQKLRESDQRDDTRGEKR
ncbi:hypothetical protein [Arhodomonas sp. SL1]|uniref:hypothetical protein n=1 Tax=Arhodomonas sp. SL1 TaxID=3425691 RepID=UPI003F88460D